MASRGRPACIANSALVNADSIRASRVTSDNDLGCASAAFSSSLRASSTWSRDPQFDTDSHGLLMLAGQFDHLPELTVPPVATAHVSRVDPILVKRLGAAWKLREQLVPVVVEVADQGNRAPGLVQTLTNIFNSRGGVGIVDGDAYHFRTGLRKLQNLSGRCCRVSGIGVGHGLHDNGR